MRRVKQMLVLFNAIANAAQLGMWGKKALETEKGKQVKKRVSVASKVAVVHVNKAVVDIKSAISDKRK